MERANYKKVLEILDRDRVYNYEVGMCMDFTSRTCIDVDNSSGKATEFLQRVLSYIDAMLYEVDAKEPASVTDRFAFLFEDERYTLDMEYMAQDADEKDWEYWRNLREDILNAKQIRIEYTYSTDADEAADLITFGMQPMVKDILANGALADCVMMYIQVDMGGDGSGFIEDSGLESHYPRCLWVNGMHGGKYVCGEVPFEHNEQRVRSCGAWRQSGDTSDEAGIYLRLHPKTSPALLNRLRKAAKEFARRVNCEMEINLSYEDHKRNYMEMNPGYVTASMTDKAIDDKEQLNFPDLRVYFTSEEVQALLNRYPNLSALYIKHADSKYSKDELERIRFLWALALMRELEGPNRQIRSKSGAISNSLPPSEDFLNVFYKLPEDIRFGLYATHDYIRSEDSFFGREIFRATDADYSKRFFDTHSGLGDLNRMDDMVLGWIHHEGYYIRLNMAYLNGIEDVRLMCDFLNELKEIERLAQAETGMPIPRSDDRYSFSSINDHWMCFGLDENEAELTGSALENLKDIPRMTIREYHELASMNTPEEMNYMFSDHIDGNITFESDDINNWARLRFRLENGKYIYEIAQADI